jgi:hypothetical protein
VTRAMQRFSDAGAEVAETDDNKAFHIVFPPIR